MSELSLHDRKTPISGPTSFPHPACKSCARSSSFRPCLLFHFHPSRFSSFSHIIYEKQPPNSEPIKNQSQNCRIPPPPSFLPFLAFLQHTSFLVLSHTTNPSALFHIREDITMTSSFGPEKAVRYRYRPTCSALGRVCLPSKFSKSWAST